MIGVLLCAVTFSLAAFMIRRLNARTTPPPDALSRGKEYAALLGALGSWAFLTVLVAKKLL